MKKTSIKKEGKIVKIFDIPLTSNTENEVLKEVLERKKEGLKTLIFTVNPEFIIFAQENSWFKEVLKKGDIIVPDGVGLVLASKFLFWRKKIKSFLPQRVTGADLGERLLNLAQKHNWRVGVVGARIKDKTGEERRRQINLLRKKFKGAKIFALEDYKNWEKEKWDLVFACQGMGSQEKWLISHYNKDQIMIGMGIGGGLDFLTGFAPRAPLFIRKIGFEWFFRLLIQPWRWKRQLKLLKFLRLVLNS